MVQRSKTEVAPFDFHDLALDDFVDSWCGDFGLIFTHIPEPARLEIPMDLRDLRAFSPPRPASETADLVDLLQAKARSQPEA